MSRLNDASTRYAAVDNSTDPSRLEALAANPDVLLHVTRLDPRRLPEHIKATLYTEADTFIAPQLLTAGNIYAETAITFDVPQLQSSGNIHVHCVANFSAPQLRCSGNIHAARAASFSAPRLRTSGNILAGNATSFDAPLLQVSGQIIAVPSGKKS
ncbi:MAG TPA: hypothetical protein VN670_01625 [Acidobacteriaceae bacterium]|nr:hypothetical protein [Acidobacteriaceae bacterium]